MRKELEGDSGFVWNPPCIYNACTNQTTQDNCPVKLAIKVDGDRNILVLTKDFLKLYS